MLLMTGMGQFMVTSNENIVESNSFRVDTNVASNKCKLENGRQVGETSLELSFLRALRVAVLGYAHVALHCQRE